MGRGRLRRGGRRRGDAPVMMGTRPPAVASACLLLMLILSCGPDDGGTPDGRASGDSIPPPAPVTIEGTVMTPAGDTVDADGSEAVLLYAWLPLSMHGETEEDLRYLADLSGPELLVLPVQPDPASRNRAQSDVNDLGLSLPVHLADEEVMGLFGEGVLPAAVLLRPGGETLVESGFGAPSRLVSELRNSSP